MGGMSPGPWYVGELGADDVIAGARVAAWVYSAEGKLVATTRQFPGFPDAEADARLIAMAPDLLAMLQRLVAETSRHHVPYAALAEARALIARVEGR